jgi:hypothetical protein
LQYYLQRHQQTVDTTYATLATDIYCVDQVEGEKRIPKELSIYSTG